MIDGHCCVNKQADMKCISVQMKAFGLRQFSNEQDMNIKSMITQGRATGGHLVNWCLRTVPSPCCWLLSISKTGTYLPHRQREGNSFSSENRNNHLFSVEILDDRENTYTLHNIQNDCYTSGGLTNVICQDFQTELLFVFNHWGRTPPLPLLSSLVYLFPSVWEHRALTEDMESFLQRYFSCTHCPEPFSIVWIYFKVMWDCQRLRNLFLHR